MPCNSGTALITIAGSDVYPPATYNALGVFFHKARYPLQSLVSNSALI